MHDASRRNAGNLALIPQLTSLFCVDAMHTKMSESRDFESSSHTLTQTRQSQAHVKTEHHGTNPRA